MIIMIVQYNGDGEMTPSVLTLVHYEPCFHHVICNQDKQEHGVMLVPMMGMADGGTAELIKNKQNNLAREKASR